LVVGVAACARAVTSVDVAEAAEGAVVALFATAVDGSAKTAAQTDAATTAVVKGLSMSELPLSRFLVAVSLATDGGPAEAFSGTTITSASLADQPTARREMA
jgi:hypothetical protein